MHQQLWGYKVEWKSVSRGTGGKKVEYHWYRRLGGSQRQSERGGEEKNSLPLPRLKPPIIQHVALRKY
jgi:hypothetical protein